MCVHGNVTLKRRTRGHRNGDNHLTFIPISVTGDESLAHVKGPAAEACRGTGAGAVPAGGFATCSRAALGIDPAGTKTGLPGVWLSLAAARVRKPAIRLARDEMGRGNEPPKSEARPEAEGWRTRLTESRGGAPKGERIPLDALRHPSGAAMVGCASRRSASFLSFV